MSRNKFPKKTAISISLVRGLRAFFGTIVELDQNLAALVDSNGAVIPINPDDKFESRKFATSFAVKKGSALITNSSMSLAGMHPLVREAARYTTIQQAIREATVSRGYTEERREEIVSKVNAFYGFAE